MFEQYPMWLYSEQHPKGVIVQSIKDLPGLPPGETWFTSPARIDPAFPVTDEIAKIPPEPMTVQAMTEAIAELQKRQPPATDAFVAVGSTRFSDGEPQTDATLATAQAVDKRTKAYRESVKEG